MTLEFEPSIVKGIDQDVAQTRISITGDVPKR